MEQFLIQSVQQHQSQESLVDYFFSMQLIEQIQRSERLFEGIGMERSERRGEKP
jgi:hypothetical protein